MWNSGMIGAGLDVRGTSARHHPPHAPIPNTTQSVPRPANPDPRTSSRYVHIPS
jgi:hypothetical protein